MKNLKLIGILMLIASSFMFIQCTSDPIQGPQGIAGVDGVDGVDGTNGTDGVDSTTDCRECHSYENTDPVHASYLLSGHNNGTSYLRGTSASCAQCHGEEGYLDYVNTGAVNPAGYTTVSPMSCNTCHNEHSTFDFENDGQDYALRMISPVTLVIDNATVLDFGSVSNNCITCHQPRNSYAIPGPTADYEITSSRFGPHHGPQSTVLEGIMGANIAGSATYPTPGSAVHRKGASCNSCHMSESADENTGLHTWVPSEESCTSCHTSGVPTEAAGFTADMETLHGLLLAKGAITESGSTVPGTYPAAVAQAVWNYKTLEEDKSKGIHNPKYVKALLKNSIEAVD
jgi:hypothetical protein